MSSSLLTFNGIDGTTGDYGIPPVSAGTLAKAACGAVFDKRHLAELRWRWQQDTESHFAAREGVDVKDISQTGWGAIFAHDVAPAILEALGPLLELRRKQAGARYQEYAGVDAYRPDETKHEFLARHGAGPGPVDPDRVPYYLLIVGDPEAIPFRFQYQLDVQYGVGRICFDTVDEYAAYARTVVASETGPLALAKRLALFATANPGDRATEMSSRDLAGPLAEWAKSQDGWTVETFVREQATKSQLSRLLRGLPAILFTASHGMLYPSGDLRQLSHQGALLCQDWPGPAAWRDKIPDDFYFAGQDVGQDARLFGGICMHFACFGAGTSRLDDYPVTGATSRSELAPHGFISRLPQRMLAHPQGGVLAVIGHVERAWSYSFNWDRAGSQTEVFKSTLKRLMEGYPAGAALEYFNGRYAELAADLASELEEIKFGKLLNEYALSGMWTANNDARGYAIVGDPAVRLRLAGAAGQQQGPDLKPVREVQLGDSP